MFQTEDLQVLPEFNQLTKIYVTTLSGLPCQCMNEIKVVIQNILIYIYTHTHIHTYIHTYIYTHNHKLGGRPVHLCTEQPPTGVMISDVV